MKGKRIERENFLNALKRFAREGPELLLGFERKDGKFRTKVFRKEFDDLSLFNPVFQVNTAIHLRRIFSKDLKIVCILRPCETRAYVELTKLTQVEPTSLICGSTDCFGTVSSKRDDLSFPEKPEDLKTFLENLSYLRYACQTCRHKNGVFGDFGIRIDSRWNFWFIPYTERSVPLYELIEGPESEISEAFKREDERSKTLFQTDLQEFRKDFEKCIMCLNCRDMCPVCYCVDCLFNSDEYLPKGDALINSIMRSKASEIPKNKEVYHFIRMYHVSQTCVGCGSCEEACPQNIPLTKYFKGISERLSGLFDYVSGRSFEERIPYTTFKEEELENASD
jgi:formate dehydrogenase subunit beta